MVRPSLHELQQNTARATRVDESHPVSVASGACRAIDQLHPGLVQLPQRRLDVGHAVGHVMQPRSAPLEEPTHGRVGAQRLQQLQLAVARSQETQLHALRLDSLAPGTRGTRHEFEGWEHVVNGFDGDRHMVERETLDSIMNMHADLGRQFAGIRTRQT